MCFNDLLPYLKTHTLIGPTKRLCFWLFSNGKLSSVESPLFPILGNLRFTLGLRKGAFSLLLDLGQYQVSHFVT